MTKLADEGFCDVDFRRGFIDVSAVTLWGLCGGVGKRSFLDGLDRHVLAVEAGEVELLAPVRMFRQIRFAHLSRPGTIRKSDRSSQTAGQPRAPAAAQRAEWGRGNCGGDHLRDRMSAAPSSPDSDRTSARQHRPPPVSGR